MLIKLLLLGEMSKTPKLNERKLEQCVFKRHLRLNSCYEVKKGSGRKTKDSVVLKDRLEYSE